MNPAYGRVGLRYLAGYLVLKGILPEEISKVIEEDQELAALVGLAVATGVEWLYARARKLGGRL